MEALFTPQFFAQNGIYGVFLFLAYKTITKLYTDMREDSKAREDKLLLHLDKVTDTLSEVKDTLKDFDTRLVIIENCVKEGRDLH